jgi:hypothetical protein
MIINNPSIKDEKAELVRNAIEHRATWFYMLLDEVRKRGLDIEDVGRSAIYRCGCFHGLQKHADCEDPKDLREFSKVFANDTYHKVFEMEVKENTDSKLYIDFHYCPLVAAWIKAGASEEDIPTLCDIAMDGDRGIISKFEGYSLYFSGSLFKIKTSCKTSSRGKSGSRC